MKKLSLKFANPKNLTIACGLLALTVLPKVAVAAEDFQLRKNRARLVVLLHGVTPEPLQSPEQKIGQPGHARHYWGYDFIKGLQGRLDSSEMRVITPNTGGTLRLRRTIETNWIPNTVDTKPSDLAPICFPATFDLPAGIEINQSLIKTHISLMSNNQGANHTMVMINTRDGSKHLMPQLGETIDEVYESYVYTFGHVGVDKQPQIYLVGHSFGGIIARGILANPTGPDLWGNQLTAQQRTRADFLRRRVVLAQTLASPHEGTIVQDPSRDITDFITANGYNIIYTTLNNLTWLPGVNWTAAEIRQIAKDTVKLALDGVAGKRDCLSDLTRIKEYNQGILGPNVERRSANGSLVPIYTAAGRNPGGKYLDQNRSVFAFGGNTFNPISTIDLLASGVRGATESMALNLINSVFSLEGYGREGKKPWGTAEDYAGDRVTSPFKGVGPAMAREIQDPWVPTGATFEGVINTLLNGRPYTFGLSDGEWDSDGFLAWDSAHAYHLNAHSNFYRVYDNAKYGDMLPWDDDNHGGIMFNPANGAWIHNELIRDAGPYILQSTTTSRRSGWDSTDSPLTPRNKVMVQVLEVNDVKNDLDPFTQADFRLTYRVGAVEKAFNLPDDRRTVYQNDIPAVGVTNYASTIIPIKISVIERDGPPIDPNDLCCISPKKGQSSLYIYFDTRTNRVFGDINGEGGETIQVIPWQYDLANRVKIKIKVTRLP
jgi:hypothetical protein